MRGVLQTARCLLAASALMWILCFLLRSNKSSTAAADVSWDQIPVTILSILGIYWVHMGKVTKTNAKMLEC